MPFHATSRPARRTTSILLSALLVLGFATSTATIAAASEPANDFSVDTTAATATYTVSVDSVGNRDAVITELGITPTSLYGAALVGFSAKLSSAQATTLADDSRVLGLSKAATVVEGAAQTVAPVIGAVEANKAPVNAGNGSGTWDGPSVAVLDSGVNPHTDYNLVTQHNCFGSGDASDANGHGTAVSGYMAAYDDDKGIVGVAPGAPIHSVRVLDEKNKGTVENIICGIDWVVANADRLNIGVLNLSLATKGTDDENCGLNNGDVFHQAICSAYKKGITIVSSAGNTTDDLANWIPASYNEVLTATNVADYDGKPGSLGTPVAGCTANVPDDSPWQDSNFAVSANDQRHTVAAPGMCPYTTKLGNQYGVIQSGTSMSAAALSGVVLNCLRPGASCENLSVRTVQATIVAQAKASAARGHVFTGDPLSPSGNRYYGYMASTVPTAAVPNQPEPTPAPSPTNPPTPNPTPSNPGSPDTVAPAVSITSPGNGATVSGTTQLVATATDNKAVTGVGFYSGSENLGAATKGSGDSWTLSFATTKYADGTYPVVAKARDAAGNVTTSATVSLKIVNTAAGSDTTPPSATITSPKGGATIAGNVAFSATITDNKAVTEAIFYAGSTKLGGAAKTSGNTWTLNYASTRLPNGAHNITVRAKDAAGNATTSAAVAVKVDNSPKDTTKPVATITSPKGGATIAGNVTFSATITDNKAVTEAIFYAGSTKLGGAAKTSGNTWTLNYASTRLPNGAHNITVRAKDAAGNATTSAAVAVKVDNSPKDTTKPVATITSPKGGATVKGTVAFSATVTDNKAVTEAIFYAGSTKLGGAAKVSGNTWTLNYATSRLPVGSHSITVRAKDAAGNATTSAAVAIKVTR